MFASSYQRREMNMSKQKVRDLALVIGDESYFDQQGNSLHPHLTIQKVFKQVSVDLIFEQEENETTAIIHIVPGGKPKQLKLEGDELTYPESEKITDKELACDTASYIVNDIKINTMSDGYYGSCIESSSGETIVILGSGYMAHDHDDFVRDIKYVIEGKQQ